MICSVQPLDFHTCCSLCLEQFLAISYLSASLSCNFLQKALPAFLWVLVRLPCQELPQLPAFPLQDMYQHSVLSLFNCRVFEGPCCEYCSEPGDLVVNKIDQIPGLPEVHIPVEVGRLSILFSFCGYVTKGMVEFKPQKFL